jgi:hypothetical protein
MKAWQINEKNDTNNKDSNINTAKMFGKTNLYLQRVTGKGDCRIHNG